MLMDKFKTFISEKRKIIIICSVIFIFVAATVIIVALIVNGKTVNNTVEETSVSEDKPERTIKKFYDNLTGELVSYSGEQYDNDGNLKKKEDGSTLYYSEMQAEQSADQNNHARINCVRFQTALMHVLRLA